MVGWRHPFHWRNKDSKQLSSQLPTFHQPAQEKINLARHFIKESSIIGRRKPSDSCDK